MPQATYTADFSQFDRETAKAVENVKKFASESEKAAADLVKLTKSFSGGDIVRQADQMVKAITAIGGATKLTAAEQAKVNVTLQEALAKYKALGQEAPASMQALARETSKAEAALKQVSTGSEQASAKMLSLGNAATAIKGAIAGMLAAFSFQMVLSQLSQAVQKVVAFAGSITDLSAKTGVSTDALQRWNYAATQNGNTLDQITGAVTQLSKRLAEGDDSTVGALDKLGLSFEAVRAMDPETAFNTIAAAIAQVKDPMEQTRLAMELFGRSGAEILPSLKADMGALGDEAAAMGAIIDKETVAAIDNLGDAAGNLSLALQGVVARGLVPAIPTLERMAAVLMTAARNMGLVADAWLSAGGIMGGAMAGIAVGVKAAEDELMKLPKVAGDGQKEIARFNAEVKAGALVLPKFSEAATILREGVKETSDAWKKGAREAAQYQAALDKLSGKAAIDAAAELAAQITAIGGAEKVSGDQAAAAAETINAGIRAMVEDGKTVPPIWQEIATQLGIATMKMPALVDWTNKYAEAIGAVSRTDWSKIVPPKDLFPPVEPFKGVVPGAQSHPDWNKLPLPTKGKSPLEKIIGTPDEAAMLIGQTLTIALSDSKTKAKDIGGVVGGTIGGNIGKAIGPAVGKMAGNVLGPTIGKMVGSVIPIVGPILGELAGSFIGGLFGPSQKEKTETARKDWIKAAGGLEKIDEAAKRANVSTSALMKATTEKGLDKEIKKFEQALEEANKRIGETITSLGKLSKEGGLIGKDLAAKLKLDIDQKDVQEAVKQFQALQTDKAVTGLGTFLTKATVTSQAGVNALAGSLTALFGSLQQQGLSATQAIAALQVPMAAFQAQLEKTGMTAPAAFGELARLAQIATGAITGPLIEGVSGLGQAMEGLFNTGLLTQDMFAGLAAEVGATFTKLQDQGTGGRNAIALMQKPLQTIWELQQKFGYEVDETTQGVIDLALEGGQIGKQFLPAADRIAASIETLVNKLDALFTGMVTGAETGSTGAKTAIERNLGGIRVPTIEVPIKARYEGFDDVGGASVSVSPASAASVEPTSMTVNTYLDGEVIARNQMPHLARELTLLGV
jgi:hypothetical protein